MTVMTKCEIKLKFEDSSDIVTMKDKDLIKCIPLLVRAISSQTTDWESEDTVVTDPLAIPFPKEAGDFLFKHLREYVSPDKREEETTLEHYPEAAKKNEEVLKYIIELANFLECLDFVQCIGFVIAQKLKEWDVEKIAAYMGLECLAEDDGYDEDNEWMHPPLAALQDANGINNA